MSDDARDPQSTPPVGPHPAPPVGDRPASPVVEPASPDVVRAADAVPLPGAHRGGYSRLPTAPLDVVTETTAPAEPGTEDVPTVQWMFTPPPRRELAGWALGFAVVGLIVALFVGWGFPLGIVAVVTAIMALQRPLERRGPAIWALVLGFASLAYSVLWLWWAAGRANLFG